jgi:hypothetical protein
MPPQDTNSTANAAVKSYHETLQDRIQDTALALGGLRSLCGFHAIDLSAAKINTDQGGGCMWYLEMLTFGLGFPLGRCCLAFGTDRGYAWETTA